MTSYRDYGWNDAQTDAHGYLYPTLRSMLQNDRKKRILDLGCGNGVIASRLILEGFDIYGVDASASGIDIASRRHPGRFFIQDINEERLPADLSNVEFDLIISTEVIEHLYAPRSYLRLMRNVLLGNGGEVVISTPYHGYLKNLVLAITNGMDRHYTALWDGGHIKFWSRNTLTALLSEFGFSVTEFRGSGRLPYLWKSMFVRANLDAR